MDSLFLCVFGFFCVPVGIWTRNILCVLVLLGLSLADDLRIRAFFKVVILEGVGDSDITTRRGAMMCSFVNEED